MLLRVLHESARSHVFSEDIMQMEHDIQQSSL